MSGLKRFSPWRFLNQDTLDTLCEQSSKISFSNNEVIFNVGDDCDDVYVLEHGSVLVNHNRNPKSSSIYGPGIYLGERASLFNEVRRSKVSANPQCDLIVIKATVFLELVRDQLAFSRSLARSLRWKQQIFSNIDRFQNSLLSMISSKLLDFEYLKRLYKEMNPAIHSKLHSHSIDTDAWNYAKNRLPENITSVNTILFSTKQLKMLENSNSSSEEFIKTSARRRSTYILITGKIFVLLRDVVSDITDFVTNLCLHSIETSKLRDKLGDDASNILSQAMIKIRKENQIQDEVFVDSILNQFSDLNTEEKRGLKEVWPVRLIENLYNMMFQYGDYHLLLSAGVDRYEEDIAEAWSEKVSNRAREMLNLSTIILSSNTHSVVNILSPYLHSKKDEILAWGKIHKPEMVPTKDISEQDLLYLISQYYLRKNPTENKQRKKMDEEHGFETIVEEDLTGISVQLINVKKLHKKLHDSSIILPQLESCGAETEKKHHLIINIDFCFGRQAEDILGWLILVFGQSIRSVNVLGKAGGLIGKRGDVLMPTHVLLQAHDELRSLKNSGLKPKEIADLCKRTVHVGPVLTIEGTLLQDKTLLTYYNKLWQVVGLEMEGSYYVKSIERAIMTGLLSPEVESRFLYYVSDLPLDSGSTLSKAMGYWEGIPPLYATTRVILNAIFKNSDQHFDKKLVTNFLEEIKPAMSTSSALSKVKWALKVINSMSHVPEEVLK